jgi:hypothetical protein
MTSGPQARSVVELGADFHALRPIVSEGRLTALDSGRIELSVTLSCEGAELKSIHHEIDPSFDIRPRGRHTADRAATPGMIGSRALL